MSDLHLSIRLQFQKSVKEPLYNKQWK